MLLSNALVRFGGIGSLISADLRHPVFLALETGRCGSVYRVLLGVVLLPLPKFNMLFCYA